MNEARSSNRWAARPTSTIGHCRLVASCPFVGTLNMLQGVVADPAAGAFVEGATVFAAGPIAGAAAGDGRTLALRPEALRLGRAAEGANALKGVVEDLSFLGAVVRLRIRLGQSILLADAFNAGGLAPPQPANPSRSALPART